MPRVLHVCLMLAVAGLGIMDLKAAALGREAALASA